MRSRCVAVAFAAGALALPACTSERDFEYARVLLEDRAERCLAQCAAIGDAAMNSRELNAQELVARAAEIAARSRQAEAAYLKTRGKGSKGAVIDRLASAADSACGLLATIDQETGLTLMNRRSEINLELATARAAADREIPISGPRRAEVLLVFASEVTRARTASYDR